MRGIHRHTKIILDLGYDKIQLIGHCVGGMIAFEVAKNMMDKGVDVIDVSLIDSIPGKYSIEDEVVMELMFLPMVRVPTSNNEAERQLRNYKRKQKQVVSFRSNQSHDYLCKSMSMLVVMRQNESNLFDRVSRILD